MCLSIGSSVRMSVCSYLINTVRMSWNTTGLASHHFLLASRGTQETQRSFQIHTCHNSLIKILFHSKICKHTLYIVNKLGDDYWLMRSFRISFQDFSMGGWSFPFLPKNSYNLPWAYRENHTNSAISEIFYKAISVNLLSTRLNFAIWSSTFIQSILQDIFHLCQSKQNIYFLIYPKNVFSSFFIYPRINFYLS